MPPVHTNFRKRQLRRESGVILVLIQSCLKFGTASPHEDHQDWTHGHTCQDDRSALGVRHKLENGDLGITMRSTRIRTRFYEDLTTSGLLIQTIVHERIPVRLYDTPAANVQWIDQTSRRVRVWHERKIAGIYVVELLSNELSQHAK